MLRTRLVVSLAMPFLFISSVAAQIVPITRYSEVRIFEEFCSLSCFAGGMPSTSTTSESISDFSDFNVAFGGASQASGFPDAMTVSAVSEITSRTATTEFGALDMSSIFQVEFNVPVTSDFTLVLDLRETDFVEEGIGINRGGASFSLSGPETTLMYQTTFSSDVLVNETGVLSPGNYNLELIAGGSASSIEPTAEVVADMFLQVVAIPEPASALWLYAAIIVFATETKQRAG